MTAGQLNRLSADRVTAMVQAQLGPNFYAAKRRGIHEIRYAVPGSPLCVALAGDGPTWLDALRTAVRALGLVLPAVAT